MNARKSMNRRFHTLLKEARNVPPGSDVIREIADLAHALDDAPAKRDVVARLTVTRKDKTRTIVEVYEGATYSSFYHYFAQQGNKRSTKRRIRTGGRHDAPGLDSLAVKLAVKLAVYQAQSNPVIKKTIRIIKKREYRRLIDERPDQLGLVHSKIMPLVFEPSWRTS